MPTQLNFAYAFNLFYDLMTTTNHQNEFIFDYYQNLTPSLYLSYQLSHWEIMDLIECYFHFFSKYICSLFFYLTIFLAYLSEGFRPLCKAIQL